MKKSFLLFPIALLSVGALSACNSNQEPAHITYGSYINTTNELTELTFESLSEKMMGSEKGENFLLAMHRKDSTCGCWNTFKTKIQEYIKKTHTVVYEIDRYEFSEARIANEDVKSWGLSYPEKDEPRFFIIQNGKVTKTYMYNSGDYFFKKADVFEEEINKVILEPNLFIANQEYVDKALFEDKKETIVHYIWSFCPDCVYCDPNALIPYANSNQMSKKVLILDCGNLLFYEGAFDKTNPNYVSFLSEHQLSESSNANYGYSTGKVPTTQYWKDGELKDASVYFNDVLEKDGDNYKVASTFYTEARKDKLHYLDKVETKVLEGMSVPASDVEGGSWDQQAAAKYHTPFLNAFLDTYAK